MCLYDATFDFLNCYGNKQGNCILEDGSKSKDYALNLSDHRVYKA